MSKIINYNSTEEVVEYIKETKSINFIPEKYFNEIEVIKAIIKYVDTTLLTYIIPIHFQENINIAIEMIKHDPINYDFLPDDIKINPCVIDEYLKCNPIIGNAEKIRLLNLEKEAILKENEEIYGLVL